MAYDEAVAERLRAVFAKRRDVEEKRMFGGIAFMVRGHMCVGVNDRDLMVRVGAKDYERALTQPHARPMDFTGRPLTGFVYVGAKGIADDAALRRWVERALKFNKTQRSK